ncbi:HEPN_Apea domain-containing protein [Vibrio chagasii]|nr:HEPN_Apea domain-containing protein [Vibrio chagasii]CAH7385951.1 HEPN_Apea domain-containing protein [Vibrio chagasii]
MKPYLIVKVLEMASVCLPTTTVYANVELRSSSADSPEELAALEACSKKLNLDFTKYSHCARIATIVESNTLETAVSRAESRFEEILDLKSIEVPISNYALSSIGFVKDLFSGKLHEFKQSIHQPTMSFMTHQGNTQRVDITHCILAQNSELSARYLRSLHWFRNSKHENNSQLKILFNWFAVEALLKESEKDNVAVYIRWFLGFPNGKAGTSVDDKVLSKLESHENYLFWKKELVNVLEKIRIFRNDSTHHGFRSIDFTPEQLELFSQVMIYGVTRCQGAVQTAMLNGVKSAQEFKEYMPTIFESNQNLINDVHGNILFSLHRLRGA